MDYEKETIHVLIRLSKFRGINLHTNEEKRKDNVIVILKELDKKHGFIDPFAWELYKKSKNELQDLCKEKNISIKNKFSKKELERIILEHENNLLNEKEVSKQQEENIQEEKEVSKQQEENIQDEKEVSEEQEKKEVSEEQEKKEVSEEQEENIQEEKEVSEEQEESNLSEKNSLNDDEEYDINDYVYKTNLLSGPERIENTLYDLNNEELRERCKKFGLAYERKRRNELIQLLETHEENQTYETYLVENNSIL